jgi:2-oxoglutarate dehydrogenase E1 component
MNNQELQLEFYGFSEKDLDRMFDFTSMGAVSSLLGTSEGPVSLRHIYNRLREVYCGNIGYEYMHIPFTDECQWLRERIETQKKVVLSKEMKMSILSRLTWADHFENFLAKKFSAKRFGLEGGDSTIPGLKAIITQASKMGCETVVMGMPHRGRLAVLATVVRKPVEKIFSEFAHVDNEAEMAVGSGDVKYHLGASYDREISETKKNMHITLLANPSHLEAVNPIVEGKTRAKQFYSNDVDRKRTMSLLIHGDAAFSAQGVVYETISMSHTPSYTSGGTVHLVINNQIGFTTDPQSSRSSFYCSDIAKSVNAPIFHVNGDDVEAVTRVCELATEFRMKFGKNVVIDLICYRKHGHNEVDEPSFTQPTMYQKIKLKKSPLQIYQEQLLAEGSATKAEIDKLSADIWQHYEEKYEFSKSYKPMNMDWMAQNWKGMMAKNQFSAKRPTGVEVAILSQVGLASTSYPAGFKPHPRLVGVLNKRVESIKSGKDIDWATAEQLAYGTLMLEGYHVRLSGQDVERGTFSQRHAVLHDQTTNATYTPLSNLSPTQAKFSVTNSSLSEYGCLGFEVGYASENPNALVMWEAQFGDFANCAQPIFDQFLSSQEDKWLRLSGLVVMLPHGYEGQGPEHSSARLERFLQQCDDDPYVMGDEKMSMAVQKINWQVVNCSTPANWFHVLRRQLMRSFRKPLIAMTPKSLLRLPAAASSLDEMGVGTAFRKVIPENRNLGAPASVKRLIMCSGKVYYDLVKEQARLGLNNVAIIRCEQLAPFPKFEIGREIQKYSNAELVWVQEEPMNMGAFTYVEPRIETCAKAVAGRTGSAARTRYVGRPPSAATATGSSHSHDESLAAFLKASFEGL